ncbi:MAG: MFS transporter [Pseudomonadota bacterium]
MTPRAELVVALLATIAAQALTSIAVYTPAVVAPAASRDIGVEATTIGAFTSLIYLLAAVSAPIGGAFVARRGAVRVSQICLVLTGTGLAMCGLVHPAAVLAGALLIGMGYGPVTPASSALLIEHTPDRMRNLIMSIRQTGVPIGGALAGVTVPWLMVAGGWRFAVLVMGGLCVVLALVLQTVRRVYDGDGKADPRAAAAHRPSLAAMLKMVYADVQLRRLSYASFAYAGMQMCFASYLVVFLTGNAGMGVVNAGYALSAAMIAGIVGRIVWGVIADYSGNPRLLLALLGAAMAVCALTMAMVSAAWPFAAVLLLCVVFGATAVGWNGVYVAEVAHVAPAGKVAVATGASLALTYFGAVVGPFIFWLIVTLSGSYAVAFASAALVTLAAAVAILRKIPASPAYSPD